jgi:hypothetical protein
VTSLASVRTDLYTALYAIGTATTYRRRQTNYQYPALIVGWPQSMDVRAAMGGIRDFVIDVHVGVEVFDDDSSDDLLSDLLEDAVSALQDDSQWDIHPVTDFGEDLTADNRVILWCRIPVAVFS